MKCTFPLIRPFYFDPALSQWSRAFHGGVIVWQVLHGLLDHPWLNSLITFNYYVVWAALCAASPLLAAFIKDRVLRRRYLMSYILAWILFGVIAALMFMSAGPIFYEHVTGDAHRYKAMQTYLRSHGMDWGPAYLWHVYKTGAIEPGGGISDFPSMHVTIATLATCLSWSINRWLGVVMTLFTALIVVSSVYLGWHYAVGDYVVAPMTCLLWRSTAPRKSAFPILTWWGGRLGGSARPWAGAAGRFARAAPAPNAAPMAESAESLGTLS